MTKLTRLLPLFAVLASVPACATPESEAAHAAVANGALLLDVRTPEEYAAGHVDGAVNIPFDQLESRLSEVGDTDREIVVYCHSGNRSRVAASTLDKAGYDKVIDLGPMHAW